MSSNFRFLNGELLEFDSVPPTRRRRLRRREDEPTQTTRVLQEMKKTIEKSKSVAERASQVADELAEVAMKSSTSDSQQKLRASYVPPQK